MHTSRVETKHRIARNLARIARKFTRSTKIEIEMLEKILLDFCSDRKKIENFMLEIARIETQCSKCSLDDRSQNSISKYRKYLHFFGCHNEKNMCFSYFWSKCTQRFSIWLKYLPEIEVDSKLSSIMLKECLVSLEKCSNLLENFFQTYARDRSVIARNFLTIEMLDHFSARDRSDRKFKIKNCARDRSDRKFQCSKCSRSMFLPLGLNSNSGSNYLYLSL